MSKFYVYCVLLTCLSLLGCTSAKTSNTSRTGMEQLLISNAVDQSLDKIDFRPFRGKAVFLDEKYIECTDKNYVVSSIRHRLFHAGAQIVPKLEDAEIVVEARSGGVGTDQSETFVGMPEIAVPGPMPIALPEIKLWNRNSQSATAKIALVAYETENNHMIGQGGTSLAKSIDNNWFIFGLGPYKNGSVVEEVRQGTAHNRAAAPLPRMIAFNDPALTAETPTSNLAASPAVELDSPEMSPEPMEGVRPANATDDKAHKWWE